MARFARIVRFAFLACALPLAGGAAWASDAPSRELGGARADAYRERACRLRYRRIESGTEITGHGTAFAADLAAYGFEGRRYLLSAAHNVLDDAGQPYRTLEIETGGGWSACRVLAHDRSLDICLLEAQRELPEAAQLADTDAAQGDAVILAGAKRGQAVRVYEGVLEKKFHRGSARYRVRVPFDHGDSGGPFFDAASGRVVGVAVAGVPLGADLDPGMGLYAPLAAVRSFLDAHRRGGSPLPEPSRPEPAPGAIAASAEVRQAPAPTALATREVPVTLSAAVVLAQEVAPATPAVLAAQSNSAPRIEVAQSTAEIRLPEMPAAAAGSADAAPEVRSTEPAPAHPKLYRIRYGDTLSQIAEKLGVRMQALMEANNIRDPNCIAAETILRVP
ncbi:MAG: trypsin-like peptidase domain-containing protein [Planctomycetes bacterium]|nr:trypsin-like peptidase domain-containing protein [Planctomycetota bacterium]